MDTTFLLRVAAVFLLVPLLNALASRQWFDAAVCFCGTACALWCLRSTPSDQD